jgi:hypothetical protein
MPVYHPADLVVTPALDLALTAPLADDPEVIETFNIWLYDGARNIGFNVHPRATGGTMDCAITIFLPDGRIARANHGSPGTFTDATRPSSEFVKLHIIEPGKRWEIEIVDAAVWMTSDAEQAAGGVENETPTTRLSLSAVVHTTSPAWVNGALLPESRVTLGDRLSWWMGNRLVRGFDGRAFRYDHLVTGGGTVSFEGQTTDFTGSGLRGHVRGVRRMPGMLGHCWAEGCTADGRRGFGTQMFLREGGGYEHSEAMLWQDGTVYPARIIAIPHLDRDSSHRDTVFELACDAVGLVRILAHDVRAFWWRMPNWGTHGPIHYGCDPSSPTLMKQGVARFTWEDDGAIGYGLVERSG